jgi:hypothetical protein
MGEQTKCPKHPGEEAIGFCHKCGRPVCGFCGNLISEFDKEEYYHIRVRDMLKNLGLNRKEYVCDDCYKIRFKITVYDIIGIVSGLILFFIGLFIEFLPLSLIGAIIFIGYLYDILKAKS